MDGYGYGDGGEKMREKRDELRDRDKYRTLEAWEEQQEARAEAHRRRVEAEEYEAWRA